MSQQEDQQPKSSTAHLTSDSVGGDLPPATANAETLFAQFVATLSAGQRGNIADASKRGESITRRAFDFALAHGAVQ